MNMQRVAHKPVLVKELLATLHTQSGGTYLDVTFGSGGHTRALLASDPTIKVVALDWDLRAIELYGQPLREEYGDRLHLIWGNFALLYKLLPKEGISKVNGIFADFGTSQVQLAERAGFSFYRDTPLDMRMSPAHHVVTAADLLATASEEKLRQIFWQYGQTRYAKQVARAIVQGRTIRSIKTTKQLADLIARVVPSRERRHLHPATQFFQAIRIYVNHELENIEAFLSYAVTAIVPGGRLVAISFHSLEDRIVKSFFHCKEQEGVACIVTNKPVIASFDEVHTNPAARSAKLRAVQIVDKRGNDY